MRKKDKMAVDIDGVIANYVDSILPFMNTFFNSNYNREDVTVYEFHIAFAIEKNEFDKFWEYMNKNNLWSIIKPMSHAQNTLKDLQLYTDFDYVTSRNIENKEITKKWLNDNHFPEKRLIFCTDKCEIAKQYTYYIDDNLEDCIKISKLNNIKAIYLFDAPWNRKKIHTPKIIRIFNWMDIKKKIINSVKKDQDIWRIR